MYTGYHTRFSNLVLHLFRDEEQSETKRRVPACSGVDREYGQIRKKNRGIGDDSGRGKKRKDK